MREINEKKFYEALEKIFTGAEIEGESGYVNLLKIKSKYYQKVLEEFKKEIDEEEVIKKSESFKEEFFDKLYNFFQKYFSESGSVYFVKTAHYNRVYEQVYTDNKDVVLFWKTHMLYYVKSDILFQSMDVKIKDEETMKEYEFYFDVSELEGKQNNEKKTLVFAFDNTEKKEGGNIFVFKVSYKEGKKSGDKVKDLAKKLKVSEEILEKSFRTFKKQSEVDFFINKNAEKFLTEQLDLYLHQILLTDENKFDQQRLDQIKTIKTFAQKIIKFIAQFEDELVKVWNKPKFALNGNYVITIDKLNDEILEKVEKHKNIKEQIKEWQELGMVENDFDFVKRDEKKHKFLPIDTKYFKDLEIEILSLFENLDEELDGRLIHSENYQALNTLKEKYKEKVQCIYIDPPYNAPSSEIIYVNKYKHSSWITLMENRISLAKSFLTKDGVFECAIDKQEQENLGKLLENIFPEKEKVCVTVVHNPRGIQGDDFAYKNEFIYFMHNKKTLNKLKRDDIENRNLRDNGGESLRTDAKNCFFGIKINKENLEIFDFTDVCSDDFHPNKNVDVGDFIEVYPVDNNGIERKWRYARQSIENIKHLLNVKKVKDSYEIYKIKDEDRVSTVWTNAKYDANEYGKKILNNIVLNNGFEFPKSLYNTQDAVLAGSKDDSLILDFFPGSGTTAHAIIDLNKKNKDSKRKYILTELGEHINTVIIPRIKKVCFADNWENGKVQGGEGISQFFKYYSLEQYEDTLRNMKYKDLQTDNLWSTDKKVFEEYIFATDQKFADVISENKDDVIKIDFEKMYKNIDFPETISNVLALPIKKITEGSVILQDGKEEKEVKYNLSKMNEEEKMKLLEILKPLLWWGE